MRLILGVDPAQRLNGYAWQLDEPGARPRTATFDGVENLLSAINRDLARYSGCELWAVIECPTWSGHGTKEVRSAALSWDRALHQVFPDRHVCRVDPRVWQGLLLKGCPGPTTKDRSLFRARALHQVACKTDHEADALCLMEYAMLRALGQVDAKAEISAIKRRSRRP